MLMNESFDRSELTSNFDLMVVSATVNFILKLFYLYVIE